MGLEDVYHILWLEEGLLTSHVCFSLTVFAAASVAADRAMGTEGTANADQAMVGDAAANVQQDTPN